MSAPRITTLPRPANLETIAPGGRIGLLALATDFNAEEDMRRMLPPGAEMFTTRIMNANPMTLENLSAMAEGIPGAAASLLPGLGVDVMIYGCTSGTVAIGAERVATLVHETCPGVAVTNPLSAAAAACRALGAKRISVLTPYIAEINAEMAGRFAKLGFEVLNVAGFAFASDIEATGIAPADLTRAAIDTCHADADLIFVACTALRASLAVADIEKALGRSCVTSNQAMVWHALELLGNPAPVAGFGRLLAERPALPA